ncbi:MAG TPA: sigma-70 family RNA polymerase sigma factor [Trebonia sp.]|nr:sigma-70 family RNA polymerase sigma factor [Trebonia sp.]
MTTPAIEDLLRQLTPQVLGALVRRHGQFEDCEDAVQEAVLAAAVQWPAEGVPDNPRGWLVTVASRRLVDQVRSEHARRARESALASEVVTSSESAAEAVPDSDDTLVLLFLRCHPTLTPASQTALTLRAVGGLTTAEIAHAFLVPEATVAARISRAKQRIKAAGSSFSLPDGPERDERLRVVLHVFQALGDPDLDDRLAVDSKAPRFPVQGLDHPCREVDVHPPLLQARPPRGRHVQLGRDILAIIEGPVGLLRLHRSLSPHPVRGGQR